MKILCETLVINRATNSKRSSRPLKSTLAIAYKNLKTGDRDADGNSKKELEIILFVATDLCTRYKVTNNIEKIFNKFQLDGKATISFKLPPDNLQIRCDPIQLKTFLHTLKLGMAGEDSINLRLDASAMKPIPRKSEPIKRMVVTKRSEYPIKGFPKSLMCLEIYDSALQKISFDICSLRYLTIVKLNSNQITKVPSEFGRLSLIELHMGSNKLGLSNNWDWLKGKPLINSLRELDLSNNQLEFFPPHLIKYENLVLLRLSMNYIKRLPFGLRRMRSLRILHVSSNKLVSLPSIFDEMRLKNFDIWGNNFLPIKEHNFDTGAVNTDNLDTNESNAAKMTMATPAPLWLQAARVVSQKKIPFSYADLPHNLVDLLLELPKCACGKLCYGNNIYERAIMANFDSVENMTFSRNYQIYEDIVICGKKCLGIRRVYHQLLAPHERVLAFFGY